MSDDDELPVADTKPKAKLEDASALPAQLGKKLRSLFADVQSQPVPDRLRELLDALAAKDKQS